MKPPRLKDLAPDEKPRERLLAKGKESLSNAELIAILLGSGTSQNNVIDISRRLMQHLNHSLYRLSQMSLEELMQIKGIGRAKAVTLLAATELAQRKRLAKEGVVQFIHNSDDAYKVLRPHLELKPYEEFWILLLNRRNEVIRPFQISVGGISGTLADPKKIFKAALEFQASGLILGHNHPSGNLQPSKADMRITSRIQNAAKHLDIDLLDHLIVTLGGYYSFADNSEL